MTLALGSREAPANVQPASTQLVEGSARIQRSPFDTSTRGLHETLTEEFAAETGIDKQPGLQYTQAYAKWLGARATTSSPHAPPPPTPTPTPTPTAAPKPCKYTVKYSKPKKLNCDQVWRRAKGTSPPAGLCGAGLLYDILSVTATGSGCPATLQGLKVSETVKGNRGCTPPGFSWPRPKPCTIRKGGKLEGCTDTYSLCGPAKNLGGNCTEIVTQKILVDGKVAETHTITFAFTKTATSCSATVTRK
jgi:hypothetical protein